MLKAQIETMFLFSINITVQTVYLVAVTLVFQLLLPRCYDTMFRVLFRSVGYDTHR